MPQCRGSILRHARDDGAAGRGRWSPGFSNLKGAQTSMVIGGGAPHAIGEAWTHGLIIASDKNRRPPAEGENENESAPR